MITEEQCTEKTCLFCASDYHLEMILLPYIKNKIDKNKIIIFTENNLEESINVVLNKVNLSESDKKKIRDLNWKNTEEEELEGLNDFLKNVEIEVLKGEKGDMNLESLNGEKNIVDIENKEKNTIVIINGSFDYIKNVKSKINGGVGKNVEIVECFHIEDVDISELSQKYENILNTKKI